VAVHATFELESMRLPWRHSTVRMSNPTFIILTTIQSSKGIGEPPLFLGAAALFALRDALVSARKDNGVNEPLILHSPATAERLRLAVGDDLLKLGTVQPKEGEKNFFVAVA